MNNACEEKHNKIKRIVRKKLISNKYLFFNIILQKFQWLLDYNCPEDAFGYIKFKDKDINILENGAIYSNSKIIMEEDYKSNNYLFLLFHEMLHIVHLHGPRQKNRDSLVWNLAADHIVNSFIIKNFPEFSAYGGNDKIFILDNHPEFLKAHNEKKLKENPNIQSFLLPQNYNFLKTTEEVYNFMIENGAQERYSYSGGDKNSIRIKDNLTGTEYVISLSGVENEDAKNLNNDFSNIYNSLKHRGLLSGNSNECLDNLLKIELPWEEILKNVIKSAVISEPIDRSWRNINKIYRGIGYILPGAANFETQKIGTGIISIDTSASISRKNLHDFGEILIDSLDHFKKIIMITHDTVIHQIEEFDTNNNGKENLRLYLKTTGFIGRGGTSHVDVFKKIQYIFDKDDEPIAIYIGLTDGFSDIKECFQRMQWSKNNSIPSCFLITKNGTQISGVETAKQIIMK